MVRRALETTYRAARRIVVGLIGATVICVGILLIVLPGPAIIVIPMGLGILGLEFAWARRWLRHVRERSQVLVERWAARGRSGTGVGG